MLTVERDEMRSRAADWVRRHYPEGAWVRSLQQTFNLEQRTAERILEGKAASDMLLRMSHVFGPAFREFVFGNSAPALRPCRYAWASAQSVIEAPAGHAVAARLYLGRSPSDGVDFAGVAKRNLGWVSLALNGSQAELGFHKAADPAALKQARDWLATAADRVRQTLVSGQPMDPPAALVLLDRLIVEGAAKDATHYGWSIERRSLAQVSAPALQRFITARTEAGNRAGTLPRLLARTGLLPQAALYHRDKAGELRTLHLGDHLGIDPVEALGKPIRAREHKPYVGLLEARLDVARIEPTFHALKLETAGHWWDYESVADADKPAPDGSQILAAVVNIKSRVAA